MVYFLGYFVNIKIIKEKFSSEHLSAFVPGF